MNKLLSSKYFYPRKNFAKIPPLPPGFGGSEGIWDDYKQALLSLPTALPLATAATAGIINGGMEDPGKIGTVAKYSPYIMALLKYGYNMYRDKGQGASGKTLEALTELAATPLVYMGTKYLTEKALPKPRPPEPNPSLYQSPVFNASARSQNFSAVPPQPGVPGSSSSSSSSSSNPTLKEYDISYTDPAGTVAVNMGSLDSMSVAKGISGGLLKPEVSPSGEVSIVLDIENAAKNYLYHPALLDAVIPSGSLGRDIKKMVAQRAGAVAKDYVDVKKAKADARISGDTLTWGEFLNPFSKSRAQKKAAMAAGIREAEENAYRAQETREMLDRSGYTGSAFGSLPDLITDAGKSIKSGLTSGVEGLQGIFGENQGKTWGERNRQGLLTAGGLTLAAILGLLGYNLYRGRQKDNMMRSGYMLR